MIASHFNAKALQGIIFLQMEMQISCNGSGMLRQPQTYCLPNGRPCDKKDTRRLSAQEGCHASNQQFRERNRELLSRRSVVQTITGSLGCCSLMVCAGESKTLQRDIGLYDSYFAWAMGTSMGRYEESLSKVKQRLFTDLMLGFQLPVPPDGLIQDTNAPMRVLEVGFGTGPNLMYYKVHALPVGLHVTGLEPNLAMRPYAEHNAELAGFQIMSLCESNESCVEYPTTPSAELDYGSAFYRSDGPGACPRRSGDHDLPSIDDSNEKSVEAMSRAGPVSGSWRLSLVQGRVEELPFKDDLFDAVVCTLVLCSVSDPAIALSEMRRVLKCNGRLLFVEHVIAPEAGLTRVGQKLLDPLQQLLADGCHLTRDTHTYIKGAGFDIDQLDGCRFDVKELGILGPHIAGVVSGCNKPDGSN
ncbi:hypothetical protein CEUSTIGMA_g8636.t1 [Chlamydomonas eustigma]|uniref:Methyltransferase type 11 domain-containing protein n=1 Tax=Chlamydomonas eustigma TaxID=1157962 RepID=A0A250XDR8_9CHLO|nr:hypothetical protein CEUSTIGMA_g8636.t1 [Chlamydomonas eustigma]|eukprot:GAX81204.1 hypothetical protein CEUSTIGMA_g8636.t1 [Chlamydomonas eustigma]